MDHFIAIIPLVPSLVLLCLISDHSNAWKVYVSMMISVAGYVLTISLIPVVSQYTLKAGLSGKDLGKRGTPIANVDVPEALGVVSGTVYLICTILSQQFFLDDMYLLTISNSALFSVCFMIFLGFVDDTVDLKWRFKLILPTIASLPLLVTYSGFTSVYVPLPFRSLIMNEISVVTDTSWLASYELTGFGKLLDIFFTVDMNAKGAIIELSYWFMIFMGLLAVFCTNAINILAGINGLGSYSSVCMCVSIYVCMSLYIYWFLMHVF